MALQAVNAPPQPQGAVADTWVKSVREMTEGILGSITNTLGEIEPKRSKAFNDAFPTSGPDELEALAQGGRIQTEKDVLNRHANGQAPSLEGDILYCYPKTRTRSRLEGQGEVSLIASEGRYQYSVPVDFLKHEGMAVRLRHFSFAVFYEPPKKPALRLFAFDLEDWELNKEGRAPMDPHGSAGGYSELTQVYCGHRWRDVGILELVADSGVDWYEKWRGGMIEDDGHGWGPVWGSRAPIAGLMGVVGGSIYEPEGVPGLGVRDERKRPILGWYEARTSHFHCERKEGEPGEEPPRRKPGDPLPPADGGKTPTPPETGGGTPTPRE